MAWFVIRWSSSDSDVTHKTTLVGSWVTRTENARSIHASIEGLKRIRFRGSEESLGCDMAIDVNPQSKLGWGTLLREEDRSVAVEGGEGQLRGSG